MKEAVIFSYDYETLDLETIHNKYIELKLLMESYDPNIAVIALPNNCSIFKDTNLSHLTRLRDKLNKIIELKERTVENED